LSWRGEAKADRSEIAGNGGVAALEIYLQETT
jgi:hypothetical protein